MPDDDFKAFWQALAWPNKLSEEVKRVTASCLQKREDFANAMQSEQDAFQKQLDKIERIVSGFGKYVDLGKVRALGLHQRWMTALPRRAPHRHSYTVHQCHSLAPHARLVHAHTDRGGNRPFPPTVPTAQVREISTEVKKLQEEIKEAESKKALFNKREFIFGQDITDYSQVAKIAKVFDPYAALWNTAFNWTTWQVTRVRRVAHSSPSPALLRPLSRLCLAAATVL